MNQFKTVPILLTIIAVLFVSILVVLAIYLPKNKSAPVKIDVAITPTIAPTIKPIVVAPTPTSSIPNDWKTYTNTKFGFQISYPKTGTVRDKGCFETGGVCGDPHQAECGNGIQEVYGSTNFIGLENYFGIFPTNWDGSIKDYLNKNDLERLLKYTFITNYSADEAIKITEYIQNPDGPSPPTLYIFRKGNKIITLNYFHDDGSKYGCFSRDPTLTYKIAESFKFTQ